MLKQNRFVLLFLFVAHISGNKNQLLVKKFVLLTTTLVVFIALSSNAQINQGTILLGGGISGNSSKSGEGPSQTKNSWFSLAPSIGFAVKENKVIGINLFYSHNKYAYNSSPIKYRTTNGYGGGVFYRSYLPLAKKFYLFGEGNAYFRYTKQSDEQVFDTKYSNKQTEIGLSVYPGLSYAVNKRFHLEASINNLLSLAYYRTSNESVSPISTTKVKGSGLSYSANVSSSSPLTLGFRFVLGK